jgi:ketosteroid isomerase-like protein
MFTIPISDRELIRGKVLTPSAELIRASRLRSTRDTGKRRAAGGGQQRLSGGGGLAGACRRRTWSSSAGSTRRSPHGTGRPSRTSGIRRSSTRCSWAPGPSGGIAEITEFFDSYSDLYTDFRVEAEEIVEVGDQVVAVERLAGRGLRGSEAWVRESFARLISFRDGKIWRAKEYATRAEALEAAAAD